MPHREEVLDVIDHTPVWDSRRQLGRMSALWRIDGERAYWYMYRNLFPKLRNASYVKLYFDDDADRNFVVIGRASELIAAAITPVRWLFWSPFGTIFGVAGAGRMFGDDGRRGGGSGVPAQGGYRRCG